MSRTDSLHRAMPDSYTLVRDAVAGADRIRRARDASRRLWRAAPAVAGAALIAAAVSRWRGWSALVPLAVLALGVAALSAHGLVSRRRHDVSDAAAAGIDSAAGLGGELRSASWFSGRDTGTDWADFHLQRAAARLGAIDWTQLYPVGRARFSRIVTGLLVVGAVALMVVASPGGSGVRGGALTPAATPGNTSSAPVLRTDMLPLALPKDLEELLREAETGVAPPAADAAAAVQLQQLLAQLAALQDPKALKALAEAMALSSGLSAAQIAQKMQALADRTKRAADLSMNRPEVRAALEELSQELAKTAAAEQSKNGEDPSDATASKDSSQGESGKAEAGKDSEDASLQFTKDAGTGSGIGVLMTSSDAAPSGDVLPGVGLGGASGDRPGGGKMAQLEQALRHETVDASVDTAGENVVTAGTRRKTEHGNAAVTFTRGAGTVERGRASAAPAVPEARRTGVQTYFVRKQ
ncbi:MAG: hypothetical protein ABI818_07525 [Acidobacteriota bacterium]